MSHPCIIDLEESTLQDWSNQQYLLVLAAVVIVLFAVSVLARIRSLSKQSEEIHKKLDYSKMKKWEDDDDWGEPPADPSDDQAFGSSSGDRFGHRD